MIEQLKEQSYLEHREIHTILDDLSKRFEHRFNSREMQALESLKEIQLVVADNIKGRVDLERLDFDEAPDQMTNGGLTYINEV
jgi:hypothetical protein